jgi:peptidoglycan LD-endopeptidase LytH
MFDDQNSNPPFKLFISDTDLKIRHLGNHQTQGPAQLTLIGKFMGSGATHVNGTFLAAGAGPAFNLNIAIENTDMTSLNPLLRAYGRFDVAQGRFSLYSQLGVKNGNINSYVKPMFSDLVVYEYQKDKNKGVIDQAKHMLLDTAGHVFKNRETQKVATQVSISGTLKNTNVSTWDAFVEIVKNAFVKTILPGSIAKFTVSRPETPAAKRNYIWDAADSMNPPDKPPAILQNNPAFSLLPAAHMWRQLVPAFIVIQLFSFSASALPQQPAETLPTTKRLAQDVATSRDRVERIAPEPAIASPIRGMKASELRDTFNEMHNGHRHEAIDISEPAGTPVRAVVDGTIQKLFFSKAGGNTIYEFDRGGVYCYYYAHLERYSDGLHDGRSVSQGDVIGYVGSTGDASPAAPHLHFAIYLVGPQKHWWKGSPIDPYPILERTLKRSSRSGNAQSADKTEAIP